jgi:vitamin B12 transporter
MNVRAGTHEFTRSLPMLSPALAAAPSRAPDRAFASAAATTLILALALAPLARAQSPSSPTRGTLDPVVVTAARSAQPIADALADITYISGEEIVRSGVQSLTELLQRQPGVEIIQNGGPASVSGVLLRGANRGQTLVLVDGLRVGSSSAGATTFEAIPLDQIDHIEILRGPASSLYGADAIGGVVQVFTKKAQGSGFVTNASAGYGTYDTWQAAAGFSATEGAFRASLQAAGRRSNGFNAYLNPDNAFVYNPDDDGYRMENLSASASWQWAPGQEVAGQYLGNRLNAQYDGGPGFDERTVTTLQEWSVTSRNRIAEWWTSMLTAGEGIDDSESQTAFGNFPYKTTQQQFLWQNNFVLPLGTLGAIVERRLEHLDTNTPFAVTQRNTTSVTGVYQLRYGDLALQANLRHDDSSQYGGKTTGALALGYQLTPSWRISAGASTGFKPPSFNDLYFPDFSNPNLVPETSRNFEGGVYWNSRAGDARWELRAVGFHNEVENLIVFQCDALFNCLPQNVQNATLEGVTFGLDFSWRDTRVSASLDLQNPTDDATGKLLPRRAREHGAIQLLQALGPLTLGAEFVASSLRYDDAEATRKMGGYGILNLTLQWPFAKSLSLLVRANNVFDKNYQLAADYSTGGTTVFAGLRWQP